MTMRYSVTDAYAREDLARDRATRPTWLADQLRLRATAPVQPATYAVDDWSAVLARWAR